MAMLSFVTAEVNKRWVMVVVFLPPSDAHNGSEYDECISSHTWSAGHKAERSHSFVKHGYYMSCVVSCIESR